MLNPINVDMTMINAIIDPLMKFCQPVLTWSPMKDLSLRRMIRKMSDAGSRMALQVKAGDRILFGKYAGSEIKVEDEEYLMMREEDILAIIKE